MNEAFENRWYIRGELTLDTDMYLGDGDSRPEKREVRDRREESADVATLARDSDGNPTIPGASLKGVLRSYLSYLQESNALSEQVKRIFGKDADQGLKDDEPDNAKRGHGGRLDVRYARLGEKTDATAVFVAIDRRTRTARDRGLFSADYVPRGSTFDVEMVGYNLDEEHVGLLLQALGRFDPALDRPLRLGAKHANQCGLATWKATSIRCVEVAHLRDWLNADSCALDSIGKNLTTHQFPRIELDQAPYLRLRLRLHFHSPVLVPDPAHKKEKDKPDCVPRKTSDGKILLPASSIRGAFRSQAERIARTLDPNAGGNPNPPNKANKDGIIERAYGYSGQRAAIEFSDFLSTPPSASAMRVREFVAIDRFTGGAAEHLKFNAEVYEPPGGAQFEGSITLNLAKLEQKDVGLFALALRDLFEGDIAFGKGAAKGWGACTAEVIKVGNFGLAERYNLAHLSGDETASRFGLPKEIQTVLATCVVEYRGSLPKTAK